MEIHLLMLEKICAKSLINLKVGSSAASCCEVVGDGAFALGDGVPRRALRRSIVRSSRNTAVAVRVNSELLGVSRGLNAQRSESLAL